MNKQFLVAAIGVGVLLTGCQKTAVMGERGYIPAPSDDANAVAPVEPAATPVKPAAAQPAQKPLYEPMTDVKPTGGIDSDAAAAVSTPASSGTYVVKAGDFPAKIARKCHVSVAALMAANNLTEESSRKLRVGQKLVIPTGKAAAIKSVKSGKKAAKKSAVKVSAAPATDADGKYVVKPGDSPAKIAKRFHVKVSALMAANNLNEGSAKSLQVGQKLIIPGKEQVAGAPAPVAPVAPVAEPAVAAPVAPVAAADSGIAADAAPAPAAPAAADATAITDNNTSADDGIEAVEIQADTTLAEFAAKNNIPLDKLRSINEGKDKLNKGDLLFVPKK